MFFIICHPLQPWCSKINWTQNREKIYSVLREFSSYTGSCVKKVVSDRCEKKVISQIVRKKSGRVSHQGDWSWNLNQNFDIQIFEIPKKSELGALFFLVKFRLLFRNRHLLVFVTVNRWWLCALHRKMVEKKIPNLLLFLNN